MTLDEALGQENKALELQVASLPRVMAENAASRRELEAVRLELVEANARIQELELDLEVLNDEFDRLSGKYVRAANLVD